MRALCGGQVRRGHFFAAVAIRMLELRSWKIFRRHGVFSLRRLRRRPSTGSDRVDFLHGLRSGKICRLCRRRCVLGLRSGDLYVRWWSFILRGLRRRPSTGSDRVDFLHGLRSGKIRRLCRRRRVLGLRSGDLFGLGWTFILRGVRRRPSTSSDRVDLLHGLRARESRGRHGCLHVLKLFAWHLHGECKIHSLRRLPDRVCNKRGGPSRVH